MLTWQLEMFSFLTADILSCFLRNSEKELLLLLFCFVSFWWGFFVTGFLCEALAVLELAL